MSSSSNNHKLPQNFKEFKPSSWAIDNRTSIFVLTLFLCLVGIWAYNVLPKESFPEIQIPKIYVQTILPGASPTNIENVVTKPLEKKLKSISGVKKITSNSYQDFSIIVVEFGDVKVDKAEQDVKDKVDETELPKEILNRPKVQAINFSEFPIMYINISGKYELSKLKEYADNLKDRIESMKEIARVEIVGALDREIQVNVDMYKMEAAQISLRDIQQAIGYENLTMSGGGITVDGMQRTLNVRQEFKTMDQLGSMIVRSAKGTTVYLRDIAEVKDSYKEQESYARLAGKNVITLNVIKRAGANLIEASDNIDLAIDELKQSTFPKELKIVTTGDQSDQTRVTLHDLINTIIIGFILVTIILMFFMGATNAIFVALSVPLSMCIAFVVMIPLGYSMNMIVLFAFLLALGIVVDDAIVVIENTHRIFDNGKRSIVVAAKMATKEVFLPVLSGTATTLAPFIPLAFWPGVIGEFMKFLPVTLIVTLTASLIVAYIINPVFAVAFMKPHAHDSNNKRQFGKNEKRFLIIAGVLAVIFYSSGRVGGGNFIVTLVLLFLLHKYFLEKVIRKFQEKTWPSVQAKYANALAWAIRRPWTMIVATIALFFISIISLAIRKPEVVFFPSSDPNFIYVYLSLPVGTDPARTNEVLLNVEGRVNKALGIDNDKNINNPLVSSVISNVAVGVTDPQDEDQGVYPNKGKVAVAFVEFAKRDGKSTTPYLAAIRDAVKGIPGAEISVAQEQSGPPVPKPITIEVSGDDIAQLIKTSTNLKQYLDSINVGGVEELRSDFQNNKPEIVFDIDRERANREGISSGQIAGDIRNAVYGNEVSKYRDDKDEYKIMLRYKEDQRKNLDVLKNHKITYMDMAMMGMVRQVPLSSVADIRYENSYGGIKRKQQKRVITLSSNILKGFQENVVIDNVTKAVERFKSPAGVSAKMVGAQEEQQETAAFLGTAGLIALGLITFILITQFNSISKPVIILLEILFSFIGVFLGIAISGMSMSIVMTGVGIVALAGIVVRNGILLVEFTDHLLDKGMSLESAIVEAGRTRMTPVLLTATATILGLIPLAVGLNIDFVTLFTDLNPHIFFGGDSVAFWGPLSWTMIFGLSFATFLTLILVPVMYLLAYKAKQKLGIKPREVMKTDDQPVTYQAN